MQPIALHSDVVLAAGIAVAILTAPVVAQPQQQTLFVGNYDSGDINIYAVAETGALSQIAGSPTAAGDAIASLALSADGLVLVAGRIVTSSFPQNSTIHFYSVDSAAGLLELPGSGGQIEDQVRSCAITRQGDRQFVYAATLVAATHAYEIVGQPGAQQIVHVPGSPFSTPGLMVLGGTAATPDGRFLYIVKYDSGIRGYAIAADGALSQLSMPALAALNRMHDAVVSPDGQHLYVSNDSSGDKIFGFTIGPDGMLTALPGSPWFATSAFFDFPSGLTITPDGQHILVAHSVSDTVTELARADDGALSLVPGSTFCVGNNAGAVATDGSHGFVLDGAASSIDPASMGVLTFDLTAEGMLFGAPATPTPAGDQPIDLALWTPARESIPGDLNGDGIINGLDLALLLGAWGSCPVKRPATCPADLNSDGIVNGLDLALLLGSWG